MTRPTSTAVVLPPEAEQSGPRQPSFAPVDGEVFGGTVLAPNGTRDAGPSPSSEEESGPGSLRERFLRPQTLVSFALAAAIIAFFFLRLDIDPAAVWANLRRANPLTFLLALSIFYLGFIVRAARWRAMLGRVGVDASHGFPVPALPGLVEIYVLSWFANCIVPAKLGDAYRSFLLKRATRAPFSTGLGTILAERLIDLLALFVAMSVAAVSVFGRHLPGQATQTLIGGTLLVALGAVGLAGMWLSRDVLERRLPGRFREQYGRLHTAVFASLRRPERFLAISVGIWLSEGLRLFLVALALGAEVSISMAVFVALLSSLLTAIPFTPAGLGVVEAAMIVMLGLADVDNSMATSIAILDRVIGYWSLVVVGLVLYARRVRRDLA
ncbi:MAG: UPF0104 membrane protein MJ1078 [uncultured Thermomicrobiales bacterium]|uniref:UPF0104 membrane protein MJ1078 n=1 Tax=uncultured Thermomicrobiales bacterium TaxID=1645740 RepID=A0A6J4VB54_9BACT|nr:MAG: UPF0104 membrane protein MJ1078 [uncultured Thermomicrobiales bacterium]